MPQVPFTQAGIDQKLAELYSQPDELLQQQASAARSDFRAWLKTIFSFSPEQSSYLDQMGQEWIMESGYTTAKAIGHRLPINLQPDQPLPPVRPSSKYVRTKDETTTSNSVKGVEVTGSVSFIIEYID